MNRFRLTTIRESRSLTLIGWVTFLVTFGLVLGSSILFIHPFLSPIKPVKAEILVVEGWLPDYALKKVEERFQNGNYRLLVTTGGHIVTGHHLSEYKTWASLAAATLNELGVPLKKIMPVSEANIIRKDRTYHTALAVKKRFNERGLAKKSIDVASLGVHARRTWLLFEKVFPSVSVGIISIKSNEYDSTRWWLFSAGVRNVISETVAYLYARYIFLP